MSQSGPERRSIELEIDVPGTPEEVWQTIATGHGITSWFVPATVDERVGGEVTLDFGSLVTARVTVWDPPRRVVFEGPADGDKQLAYEWQVHAAGGGTCTVRLVNSGFLTGAEWDAEFDGTRDGWLLFLYNLRLQRIHFPGQRSASGVLTVIVDAPRATVWAALVEALGLRPAPTIGEHVAVSAPDAPPLAGTVQRATDGMLTLLVDQPMPGIGLVAAEGQGEQSYLSVYLYLFGEQGPAIIERDQPRWKAWLERHFAQVIPKATAPSGNT